MNKIDKFDVFSIDITLNLRGYDKEDVIFLFNGELSSYNSRIGFSYFPSCVGKDMIAIELIFYVSLITTTAVIELVKNIARDLYNWTKNILTKALKKRNQFDDSRVIIKFENVTIAVYVNKRDEIIQTLKNIDSIILNVLDSNKLDGYKDGSVLWIDLNYGDIIKLNLIK